MPIVLASLAAAAPSMADSRTGEDLGGSNPEEGSAAVIDGSAFGLDPCFWVSCATSTERVETACQKFSQFCGRMDG
jgi:aspartate aminotransferase